MKCSTYRLLLLFIFILSNTNFSNAQKKSATLPSNKVLVKGKLGNGLSYYILHNDYPQKKVELRLLVKGGSLIEDNDQVGLAHFVEHMNFNGTKNFKKNEIIDYLQSIGCQLGPDINASTSFDKTIYLLSVPLSNDNILATSMQILKDWANNCSFLDTDIDNERKIILEESRENKGSEERARREYLTNLLGDSSYSSHMPIGTDKSIETFSHQRLRRYYNDWYRPDNEAIVVVGDINEISVRDLIIAHFSKLKNPDKERQIKEVEAKRQGHKAIVRGDEETSNVTLTLSFPMLKRNKITLLSEYKSEMTNFIAEKLLDSRVRALTIGIHPTLSSAKANVSFAIHGYEYLNIEAILFGDSLQKDIVLTILELSHVYTSGFTEKELQLAKQDINSDLEKAYNEKNFIDSKDLAQEFIKEFVDGTPFLGIDSEYSCQKTILPQISLEDVNSELRRLMRYKDLLAMITCPASEVRNLPTDSELLGIINRASILFN